MSKYENPLSEIYIFDVIVRKFKIILYRYVIALQFVHHAAF